MTEAAVAALKDALYTAALEYLDQGWSIFPIDIYSKKPLVKWLEFQSAPPSEATVAEWFERGVLTESGARVPLFNLGLVTGATSGVVVVDADNAAAERYAREHGMASAISVKTTRGRHFYWRHPGGGQRFANKVGGTGHDWPRLAGLDFRGDGGYVLLPPSVKTNDEGRVVHQYTWEIAIDWGDLPDWKGRPTLAEVGGDFDFGSLDLSDVRAARPEDALPVWEQAEAHIKALGRKMAEGDGRNQWLTRFAGERARAGVLGADLEHMAIQFSDIFFDEPLPEREFVRTLQSVQEMDRRNHPEDYLPDGRRREPERPAVAGEPAAASGGERRPIYFSDIDEIERRLRATEYLLDPIVAPGTITQVVGYNGHGKSFLVMGALWALACGRTFGPFDVERPARVFYVDENPVSTLISRMRRYGRLFGDPGKRFSPWNAGLMPRGTPDMNLRTKEGRAELTEWLRIAEPDVVVIDTVRSAFPGLEENSPKEWAEVNGVAKAIRDAGAAVVLVHHRNKPGEDGLGREAGSTAQLTDVDTQVIVTQVYLREEDAKRHGGLLDGNLLHLRDDRGREVSPNGFFAPRLEPDSRIRMVQQISFGKVRQLTDNHERSYVAWCERLADGSSYLLATPSPKQRARALYAGGADPLDISRQMMVPVKQVKLWLKLAA